MNINEEQRTAAYNGMVEWLKDEHELGKEPYRITLATEFDLHNLHYYVFKYKKNAFSKWMLGVCGGYEENELTNCGHVFSEMEEYKDKTAVAAATAIVEKIRKYYMDLARKDCCKVVENENTNTDSKKKGIFAGFVLLDTCEMDVSRFKSSFEKDWEYEFTDFDIKNETLSFTYNKCLVMASMVSVPVPNGEAVKNAETSIMWKEAVDVTKTHVAHIILTVVANDKNMDAKDVAIIFVKAASSLLKLKNAIGFNYCGTVFEPHFYINAAEIIKDGDIPLLNLVYFGIYRTRAGINGYTFGLKYFNKKEIEVIGTEKTPNELNEFLYDIAYYVIENDITLNPGETIGFTAEQKFAITLSKGISLEENTLKIGM